MKPRRTVKMATVAAALAAVLIVSAAAAAILLSPRDVASHVDDPSLAAAFESDDAIAMDQTIESEGRIFRLAGVVTGAGISNFAPDVDASRTYVVASMSNADGSPIEDASSNLDTVFTPLVSGYKPWHVNAWTLGGGCVSFTLDGVAYYLFECDDLEMFADHTIYLAAYQGFAPSADIFRMNDDGSISFTDGVSGPHALFTIPLDASKADPDAAAQFLADLGIEP